MNAEQSLLLNMVSQGVGNKCATPSLSVNWNRFVSLAVCEGVGAIVCDGLQNIEMEGDAKYELMASYIQAESRYSQCVSALSALAKLCRKHSVKLLVLKGYGLSLNYPVPAHRPCGDIDVYMFGCGEFINQMMEDELGISVDRENPHHSSFVFGGFNVENHNTFLDVEDYRNHIADEQLFQELLAEGCTEISVGNEKCLVPSVKLNSVYVLRHMAHHFSVGKITLRHVLDWAMFVRANHDCIDWDFVWEYAGKSGCSRFLNCLNGICVGQLGFESEMFPVRERYGRLQRRMLEDILTPYKKNLPPVSRNFRVGVIKALRLLKGGWKYRMCCNDSVAGLVWRLAYSRMAERLQRG